jgi:hypothetical protein
MDIRTRVHSRRDLDEDRANRDLTTLARKLNDDPPYERASRFITARAIITMHPTEGREIIRRLRAVAQMDIGVEYAMVYMAQGDGLDIGDPETWQEIDALVARGHILELHGTMLKSLALQPVYVDRLEVEAALYNRDTTEK